jgi:hypothetical protein
MAQTSTDKAAATEPKAGLAALGDDVTARPKHYVTLLLIAGAVIAGVLIWRNTSAASEREATEKLAENYTAAITKPEGAERAAAMQDVLASVQGTSQEVFVLFNTARSEREAGDSSEDAAKKLEHYKRGLAAARTIQEKHGNHLIATLPWRPVLQPGQTIPAVVARLADYCADQIKWLESHKVDSAEVTDPGCTATLTLTDPDGKAHALELRFFSAEAPQAVDNFIKMAAEGHFNGLLVYAQERETLESTAGRGVLLGSVLAKVAPDRQDLWGGNSEDAGFSLPREANRLKCKRGRLLMEKAFDGTNFVGISPVNMLLLTKDLPQCDDRVVFAEVSGSDETLTQLDGALAKKEPQSHVDHCAVHLLEKPWTITSVTVTGSPAVKPSVPVLRSFALPAKPAAKN